MAVDMVTGKHHGNAPQWIDWRGFVVNTVGMCCWEHLTFYTVKEGISESGSISAIF